jgi:hypothetical protein
MTQNDEKTQHQEGQLCPKCKDMYGHANFDFLCSQCYKYPFIHSENKRISPLPSRNPNQPTIPLKTKKKLRLFPNRSLPH